MISPCEKKDALRCAELLVQAFPHSYSYDEAKNEVLDIIGDNICLKVVLDNQLIGFIGALKQYGGFTYELHPLVVDQDYRNQGIGRALVEALEEKLIKIGALNLYLGTDDETFSTSLSEGDLFKEPFKKIASIKNYKNHPFSFYQRLGFKIVGVIPDANGKNKPDIFMAKRLGD